MKATSPDLFLGTSETALGSTVATPFSRLLANVLSSDGSTEWFRLLMPDGTVKAYAAEALVQVDIKQKIAYVG